MSYPEWSPESKVGDKVWWGTTLYTVQSVGERVVLKRCERPMTIRTLPQDAPQKGPEDAN